MKVIVQPLLYTLATQFYIQLVNKPHFGTQVHLFGPFRQLRAVKRKEKKTRFWLISDFELNEQGHVQSLITTKCSFVLLKVFFSIFLWTNKYCSVHTKKLINIKYEIMIFLH